MLMDGNWQFGQKKMAPKVKVVKPSHFRDVQTWRAVPRCAWSIRIFLLLARSFCSTSCRSSSFERFDVSLFAMPMCKTELSVWRCSSGCCKTSAKSVVFWVKGATSLTWLAWLTCLTWLAWLTSVTMCISMCIEDFGSTCCGDHWIIDPATRYPAQQAWWGRGSAACTASPRYWRGRFFCGCTAESSMIYAGGLYVSLCPGTSMTVWLCVRDLSPFHILSYPFINFKCSCLADSVIPTPLSTAAILCPYPNQSMQCLILLIRCARISWIGEHWKSGHRTQLEEMESAQGGIIKISELKRNPNG